MRTPVDIVIVSGSYGAGHDAAARALRTRLEAQGFRVDSLDIARELPLRIGIVLRWLYLTQLKIAPWSWTTTTRRLDRDAWLLRTVRAALSWLGRPLLHKVRESRLVVSTHPFASQVLGGARERGLLDVPTATYLTDASVHSLWVHPHVDLHVALYSEAARQARARGARLTMTARPLVATPVAPGPWSHRQHDHEPPRIGGSAALIVGGSLGIGDLEQTALDVLATGLMTPVVSCGTNERLRQRLGAIPGVIALGWRDDLPDLLTTAGCVIQNSGGMTSVQTMATSTPLFTYRPIAGHGVTNAEALEKAGVPWARDAAALRRLLHGAQQPRVVRAATTSDPWPDELLVEHFFASFHPLARATA